MTTLFTMVVIDVDVVLENMDEPTIPTVPYASPGTPHVAGVITDPITKAIATSDFSDLPLNGKELVDLALSHVPSSEADWRMLSLTSKPLQCDPTDQASIVVANVPISASIAIMPP